MKTEEIIDAILECKNEPIVVELANGQRIPTYGYDFGTNERGDPILIIKAGKKK